jgi:tripartite-type tricarboxylate transporter receptor subunit TctC
MASAGNGTAVHVFGELFKVMTGVDMVHVPYRGTPLAMTDLFAGQVHVIFDNMPGSIAYIRGGKLRPLAVTTATRSDLLPDVPALSDFVPGYEASAWYGVGAPRDTPTAIIERLNREIYGALANPTLQARLVPAAPRCRVRPPTCASSSPMRPRNGPGWSNSRAPSRIDFRSFNRSGGLFDPISVI